MSALLSIRDLVKHFPIHEGFFKGVTGQVRAVDGVSLDIGEGETLGLVGESGCGKSTIGKTIIRLLEPTSGSIHFGGRDITHLGFDEMREVRRSMQIIFQDPFSSLNPRKTVLDIVGSGMLLHKLAEKRNLSDKVVEVLEKVGLDAQALMRYPHEFSGGQRQRIGIARAISLKPKLVICDEAVSALDVSIQAQILNLLIELRKELGLSFLFISHDLSVVRHMCDRVAVMYLGQIVELAKTEELFENCAHPYTKSLISAIPEARLENRRERIVLGGDVPSPSNPPPGCRFNTRCPIAEDVCRSGDLALKTIQEAHLSSCLRCDSEAFRNMG